MFTCYQRLQQTNLTCFNFGLAPYSCPKGDRASSTFPNQAPHVPQPTPKHVSPQQLLGIWCSEAAGKMFCKTALPLHTPTHPSANNPPPSSPCTSSPHVPRYCMSSATSKFCNVNKNLSELMGRKCCLGNSRGGAGWSQVVFCHFYSLKAFHLTIYNINI